jgi:hypothetical protein
MRNLFAIALLMLSSCAPVDDIDVEPQPPIDDSAPAFVGDIIGYAPNGLPVVDAEVFPFPDARPGPDDKASIEPFVCYDEQWQNCRKPRSSWVNTDFRPSQAHTIWSHGEPGEVVSRFMVYNQRNQWYTIQSNYQGVGAVGWWIEYPLGSACRPTDTYNPTNCTFFVCMVSGTPWPRCVSSSVLRGSTFAFNGESWSPYETVEFQFVVQAHGGALPITSTFEQLLVGHSSIL